MTRGSEKAPCPKCQHAFTRVYDSRGVRRRRECLACGHRFRTREEYDDRPPVAKIRRAHHM